MEKLSLTEIFRQLLIGFVLIGVIYICEPTESKPLFAEIGSAGLPILAFVLGSLLFAIYRSTLYRFVILWFIDLIHRDNVRNTLMQRYSIPNRHRAETFWKIVQESELDDRLKNVYLGSASTHLLFMTSIVTFPAAFYLFCSIGFSTRSLVMLLVALLTSASAVASDYYIETQETLLLRSIDDSTLDQFARRMGFSPTE